MHGETVKYVITEVELYCMWRTYRMLVFIVYGYDENELGVGFELRGFLYYHITFVACLFIWFW